MGNLLSVMILGLVTIPPWPAIPSKLDGAVLNIPVVQAAQKSQPEKFLGAFRFGGFLFAVMSTTETVLDGKPTPYQEIPDEGTELIEISFDLERQVVKRMVYVSRKVGI